MEPDEISQMLADNRVETLDQLVRLAVGQVQSGVARLAEEARTDLSLRQALLTDPLAELRRRGIPVLPGVSLIFHEPGQIHVQLPPYEGD